MIAGRAVRRYAAGIMLLSAGSLHGQNPVMAKDNAYALAMIPLQPFINNTSPLPASASLKQFCPPVANQDHETCYAFAATYAARSILFNVSGNDTGITAFAPGFTVRLCQPRRWPFNKQCQRSTDITEACLSLQRDGAVPINYYPDECSCHPVRKLRALASRYRAACSGLFALKDPDSIKVMQIKRSLVQKMPVVVACIDLPSFDSAFGKEIWSLSGLGNRLDTATICHSFCVVGYNDNRFGGAFEIMNSWGPGWGHNGFIWIPYTDMARIASVAIAERNWHP